MNPAIGLISYFVAVILILILVLSAGIESTDWRYWAIAGLAFVIRLIGMLERRAK